MTGFLLLFLSGGLPYFHLLERNGLNSRTIFLVSAAGLLTAIIASLFVSNNHEPYLVLAAYLNAVFAIYRATKTTNFYKLAYYLIFINAPFFILFEEKGALYSLALLISLGGIYFIARFYEKYYGSANYHYITGITLATPSIGVFLSLYLIALSLYPPFPNSLFFLSHIFKSGLDLLGYIVVITLFFGNFVLSMRVMTKTLFGRPNTNIHYIDFKTSEILPHAIILAAMVGMSILGLDEVLL